MSKETLTDEKVAKALGWKWEKSGWLGEKPDGCRHYGVWRKGEKYMHKGFLPHFTTSLDAIVGEIKARGLCYDLYDGLEGFKPKFGALAHIFTQTCARGNDRGAAKTAPLALCHALLKYLKESK